MKLGAAMFATSYAMPPAALARALEERGFESLWAPEHSHIPLSRGSAFPAGGEMPRHYAEVMDPFVVLSVAAAATTTLQLGTGVCLVAQRDPIQTAKLVASLDVVSGGRFLFGVGDGWNAEEMANHGTAFETRHKLVRERIEAMKAIWTREEASYAGEMVRFGPMRAWPKPVQRPHPPVLVGGAFPYGARRALRYGDGWMPHRARPAYPDVAENIPEFRRMAEAAGRDPATVPITVWGGRPDPALLARDRGLGVERVIVSLPSAGADAILPELDRWAAALAEASGRRGA